MVIAVFVRRLHADLAAKSARAEFATGAAQHMLNPASARLYAAGWALLSHEEKPASSLALTRALLLACRSSGDVRLVEVRRTCGVGVQGWRWRWRSGGEVGVWRFPNFALRTTIEANTGGCYDNLNVRLRV